MSKINVKQSLTFETITRTISRTVDDSLRAYSNRSVEKGISTVVSFELSKIADGSLTVVRTTSWASLVEIELRVTAGCAVYSAVNSIMPLTQCHFRIP